MSDKEEREKRVYRVKIDKNDYEVSTPVTTVAELLTLAGKTPVDQYALYLKVNVGQPKRLDPNEKIDLRQPGVERFVTLPLDQTEGLGVRRQFALPEEDREWLDASGLEYELVAEGGALRVVVRAYPIPAGYNLSTVDINVRIDPGYPDAQIDMAYFHPPLVLLSGHTIPALCDDVFDGLVWQRWSRHRTPVNPWRPGIDSLATHFALIDDWLARELRRN